MPYRKRIFKKKTLAPVQKKAVSNMIKRALDNAIEDKVSSDYITGNIGVAGQVLAFGDPTLGTSIDDRIGNTITVKSVEIRGSITRGVTTGVNENNFCRMVIFQWRSMAPTSPVVTDILSLNAASTNIDESSLYITTLNKAYHILYDRTFILSANGDNYAEKFHIKLKRFIKKVEYNSATTKGYNQFHMILWSDSTVANHPYWNIQSKILFEDA